MTKFYKESKNQNTGKVQASTLDFTLAKLPRKAPSKAAHA